LFKLTSLFDRVGTIEQLQPGRLGQLAGLFQTDGV